MRNKLIFSFTGAAFSFAASGLAIAADMAVKAPPPPAAPVYNWTGWYAGFNFGGGWSTSNNATTTSTSVADGLAQFFPGLSSSGSTAGANAGVAGLNQSGPIGGVQIGYNFQLNPLFVFGFEADIQGAGITSDRAGNTGTSTESFAGTSFFSATGVGNQAVLAAFTNPALTASGVDSITADLNWLGTVRLRAGYLITPNLLIYATGGLAYGGVTVSDSLTTNFNFTADSFALAYAQATGPFTATSLSVTGGPIPAAAAGASSHNATNALSSSISLTQSTPPTGTLTISGTGTGSTVSGALGSSPTTSSAATVGSAPGGLSITSYAQTSKSLSVAIAQTAQSFARVSDTRAGGTIGGGIEWMMAPNWSVKAEALYYDLGSVTVTPAPLTASINPITAPIAAAGPFSISAGGNTATNTSITNAINKFTGAATVSNATSTHVSFQGVIIRLGLNYHFNFL